MNAPRIIRRRSARRAPIAASAAEFWRSPTGSAVQSSPAIPSIRPISGRLCSKGAALGETLGLDRPSVASDVAQSRRTLARVTWDAALDRVADGFADIVAKHGPNAVAFYLSGQLLTEDYYVANKLMKGFIGSANVDTNSRLCMASSVAGHRRAFGADTVPGIYEDSIIADLIILVGSNAAWCHPVLYQRMVANKRPRGARIVVIDPRRTATAEDADLFLPIAPGMDTFCSRGCWFTSPTCVRWITTTSMLIRLDLPKRWPARARSRLTLQATAAGAGLAG